MKNLFFSLSFLFLIAFNVFGQEAVFVRDSLDSYVNQAMKVWKIPGVAVAVVKNGKIILAKGYGLQRMDKPDKVDENTLFMIGSNTKAFTGTLMALFADEKKCNLQDKVIKWLPDFKMRDPWVSQELNLTDILCHRIGMETFQGDFMYWSSNLTPHEIIMKFGQLKPDYGFREKWGYTNAGFLIAGQCIEKISGESWDSNVRKKIFGPLQMGRSVALSAEYPLQKNIATPHTLVFDTLKAIPFPMIDNLAPAGSIGSSVKDMCNWMMCLLNDGEFEGKKVIPASAIQATREPRSIIGKAQPTFNRGNFNLYGLGWDLTDYEGRGIVCHTGGVNGFVTSVTLIPEEKLGIVVLTNTDQNYLYEALKWEILDSYLNLPYRNYSNLYYAYYRRNADKDYLEYKTLRDSVDMQKNKSHDLKRYVGKYSHPVYGGLTITSDKNMLKVKFEHHPNLTAKLEYLSDTRFLCTFNDPIFGNKVWPFKIDQNKVQSLTLKVAEFVEYNGYEFIKQ